MEVIYTYSQRIRGLQRRIIELEDELCTKISDERRREIKREIQRITDEIRRIAREHAETQREFWIGWFYGS